MISLAGMVDFLLDPRMPQYIPYARLRRLRRGKLAGIDVPRDSPVLVALTFDIEYDFGSSAREVALGSVEPFLQRLPPLAKELGAVFTLFIQGDLVARFAGCLHELQAEHEFGLHGYSHELWGKEKWFLPHHTTSLPVREELLKRSIKCFSDSDLTPPISFRAPDLVADTGTLSFWKNTGLLSIHQHRHTMEYRRCRPNL